MKKFLKQLFCKHKNSEVIFWHWTHGFNGNEPAFLEVQLKCKDCGKYYYGHIKDHKLCNRFIKAHKDKEWPDACDSVL